MSKSIEISMSDNLKKISKFMSYVLRHKPESIGIELDKNGWVGLDEFIDASGLSMDMISDVVRTSDKQRFAISEDRLSIRANQGHSVDIDLGLGAVTPPDVLYHGTANEYVPSILEIGIVSQKRHHVHLSELYGTAVVVGGRHGTAEVLEIDTKRMNEDGYEFYVSVNGVWLTDKVPVKYIKYMV